VPSTSAATTPLTAVKTVRSGTTAFDVLLGGSHLTQLNTAVTGMPDLTATVNHINSVNSSISSLDLATIRSNLDFPAASYNRADVLEQFDELHALNNKLPNLPKLQVDMMNFMMDVNDFWTDVQDMRADYIKERDSISSIVQDTDGYRLLVWNTMLFLPFLVSLFGIAAACFKNKPHFAMWMTLMFFPVMMLCFMLAALHMPMAVIMGDHCPIIEDMIGEAYMGKNTSMTMLKDLDFVNISDSVPTMNLVGHYLQCQGPPLEFMAKIGPQSVTEYVNNNDLNVRNRMAIIENTAFAQPVSIRPTLKTTVLRVETEIVPPLDMIAYGLSQSVPCTATSKMFNDFRSTMCTDLAGSCAITTMMLIFLGFAMVPGVIVGLVANRRFDEANHGLVQPIAYEAVDNHPKETDGAAAATQQTGQSGRFTGAMQASHSHGGHTYDALSTNEFANKHCQEDTVTASACQLTILIWSFHAFRVVHQHSSMEIPMFLGQLQAHWQVHWQAQVVVLDSDLLTIVLLYIQALSHLIHHALHHQ
jgi:hypothetical protein